MSKTAANVLMLVENAAGVIEYELAVGNSKGAGLLAGLVDELGRHPIVKGELWQDPRWVNAYARVQRMTSDLAVPSRESVEMLLQNELSKLGDEEAA